MPCKEPFVNLLTQGMVMGQSFKVKATGKYLHRDQVDFSGKAEEVANRLDVLKIFLMQNSPETVIKQVIYR